MYSGVSVEKSKVEMIHDTVRFIDRHLAARQEPSQVHQRHQHRKVEQQVLTDHLNHHLLEHRNETLGNSHNHTINSSTLSVSGMITNT